MTTKTPGRPPARADHIGSLLRPTELRHAFRQRASKEIDEGRFSEIQEKAIVDVVKLQEDAGLQVVTDGEFRRGSYWSRFVERVDGLTVKDAAFKFRDDSGQETEFTAPHVTAKVTRTGDIAVDEFRSLKPLTDRIAKITMPAPSSMHFWRGSQYADPGVYDSAADFFKDLGRVYREEIAALAAAGCRYVQLDEVALAMLCDTRVRERAEADGADLDALIDLYIEAINEAVKGRPADMVAGLHVCRGNFKGKYLAAGGYESVAEKLFQKADIDVFLLEFDSARAGNFAPLRHVPKTKSVVLGLVSSKTPEIESLDQIRAKIDEAGEHVDVAQLGVSPQCGFASTVAGNPVTEDVEKAKLARCVEAAEAIWG